MGASGSMERKSSSSKSRSPDVATPVDQPHSNGTLVVVPPSTTSSTPSSPSRKDGIRRNRSQSSDGGWPTTATEKAGNFGDDVDNGVNGGDGGESIGFSLAELASYCNANDQHEVSEENQLPDGERNYKSVDRDDCQSTADRPTSSPSNKAPLQVCGVKPPLVEQPVQKAPSVDESLHSPVAVTTSDSSSYSQQPSQLANSGAGTRTKARFPAEQTRRASDAITVITQAKSVTHRAVVARSQKTPDVAGESKVADQRRQHSEQSSAAVRGAKKQQSIERGNSGRGSRAKGGSGLAEEQATRRPSVATHDKKREQNVTDVRSEKTPTAAGDSKEPSTRQHANAATTSPAESEPTQMKVVVRSKHPTDAAPPPSNDKQESAPTTSKKNVASKAKRPPAVPVNTTPAADDDDDDEDDWMNLITSLRDPDDVRNRKTEPRRNSNWGQKLPQKPKEEKTEEEEEDDEEVNDVCNNLIHPNTVSLLF